MNDPALEIRAVRPAVCRDEPITLDVLVKILPPLPEEGIRRPPINLGLVLDRSGSMASERKMRFACDAAVFAVEQLLPTDLVSVTIYDSEVETIVPTVHPTDKASIVRRIRAIQPRSSTALFDGWKAGAEQVRGSLLAGGLNRVLLLSDGLANHGLTDPAAIVAAVKEVAAAGVATTTLGVGDDYNEDLMEGIARGGGGRYYFIETPVQLADIFQTELQELMMLMGQRVSLGIEPAEGVVVADVLNGFDTVATGRLKLPDLIAGNTIGVVIRFQIAPRSHEGPIAAFRLAWDVPKEATRQVFRARLDLPAIPKAEWDELRGDDEAAEQVILLLSGRARRDAALALERGDMPATGLHLALARKLTSTLPATAETVEDLAAIDRLEADLVAGENPRFLKRSKQQWYGRSHGTEMR